MAFRKTFRRTTRRFPRRRRLSPFAKKRYDTVSCFHVDRCSPTLLDFHACATEELPNPIAERIVLVANDLVELQFSDSCVVTSLSGWIKFTPFYELTEFDGVGQINERVQTGYEFMGGVHRIEEFIGDPQLLQDDPIADPLLNSNDYTDIKWYKLWHKSRDAADTLTFEGSSHLPGTPFGVCSDTSAAAAGAPANTLSNGSGTVNIPAISTDCDIINFPGSSGDTPVQTGFNVSFRMAAPFFLHFNMRKRIPLTGKQALVFDFNWLPGGSGLGPATGFAIFGAVKATVQI